MGELLFLVTIIVLFLVLLLFLVLYRVFIQFLYYFTTICSAFVFSFLSLLHHNHLTMVSDTDGQIAEGLWAGSP